jgi:hypothetical protein
MGYVQTGLPWLPIIIMQDSEELAIGNEQLAIGDGQ